MSFEQPCYPVRLLLTHLRLIPPSRICANCGFFDLRRRRCGLGESLVFVGRATLFLAEALWLYHPSMGRVNGSHPAVRVGASRP